MRRMSPLGRGGKRSLKLLVTTEMVCAKLPTPLYSSRIWISKNRQLEVDLWAVPLPILSVIPVVIRDSRSASSSLTALLILSNSVRSFSSLNSSSKLMRHSLLGEINLLVEMCLYLSMLSHDLGHFTGHFPRIPCPLLRCTCVPIHHLVALNAPVLNLCDCPPLVHPWNMV